MVNELIHFTRARCGSSINDVDREHKSGFFLPVAASPDKRGATHHLTVEIGTWFSPNHA